MEEQNHEMKESLNSMFKGETKDAILAAGIITANPDLVPLKDVWYNINDLISKNTVRYVELYCNEGSHDKVYIIIENKVGDRRIWSYNTIVYYGRRGKNLVKKEYGTISKRSTLHELLNSKLNKGYIIINEFNGK